MELKELENKSIYILKETHAQFKNPAILWSCGKDSTTMLWLCKKAFFGKIPFPVIHIDTGRKLKKIYEFRDRIEREWNLNLVISENKKDIKEKTNPKDGRFKCCTKLKTEALKKCINEYGFDAVIVSIRRDEHGVRGKERVFSARDKDFKWDYFGQSAEVWDIYCYSSKAHHTRVHPLLEWNELDVWKYIQQEKIPVNPLYFAKRGKRFRSLGCKPCTSPIKSNAKSIEEIIEELKKTNIGERDGRVQDKEEEVMMERLRALGYM